ncbi:MAG TPA: Hsp20/alpha crystallin family protein, partial [bacterium]|nr:Hsp20/alpha crystallin family protein [bacterium]
MNDNIVKKEDSKIIPANEKFYEPYADIFETEKEIKCVFDLPGTEKDKIKINFEKNRLSVESKTTDYLNANWKPINEEYRINHYKRTIAFSNAVDSSQIDAKYDNGVLTVVIGKHKKS